jgi:FkbM family methyltransferase
MDKRLKRGMKLVKGLAMPSFDEFMQTIVPDDGRYQHENLEAAVSHCKQRRTVIDGGAHVGMWTRTFAGLFDRVIAFEPAPDTFACLKYNVDAANVEFRNQALGAKPGKVHMTLKGFEGTKRERNSGARYVAAGGEIQRVTVDSLELQDLDLLKMDIEGSEVEALQGAVNTLLRCRPVVLFESKNEWVRRGYPENAPHEILSALGAVKFENVGIDEIWGWPE